MLRDTQPAPPGSPAGARGWSSARRRGRRGRVCARLRRAPAGSDGSRRRGRSRAGDRCRAGRRVAEFRRGRGGPGVAIDSMHGGCCSFAGPDGRVSGTRSPWPGNRRDLPGCSAARTAVCLACEWTAAFPRHTSLLSLSEQGRRQGPWACPHSEAGSRNRQFTMFSSVRRFLLRPRGSSEPSGPAFGTSGRVSPKPIGPMSRMASTPCSTR